MNNIQFLVLVSLAATLLLAEPELISYKNFMPGDTNGDRIYDTCSFFKKGSYSNTANPENTLSFEQVWLSDSLSSALCCVTIDDLDKDGKHDIVVPICGDDIKIHIYENSGDNAFAKVWECNVAHLGHIISAITTGDINKNNMKEIITAQDRDSVKIFENVSDNVYNITSSYRANEYYSTTGVKIADTDNNGKQNIVLIGSEGVLEILEDGKRVFYDKKGGWYCDLAVGCLDADPYPEIVICHGGSGEVFYDVFEYNPNTLTYDHVKIISIGTIGMGPTAEIGDINLDGVNELVVGIKMKYDHFVDIYKAIGDNKYDSFDSRSFKASGTPMDISIKNIWGDSRPEIGVCTHNSDSISQVFVFNYENDKLAMLYGSGIELGELCHHPLFSIDLCFADQDLYPDILLAVAVKPMDKAVLLECTTPTTIFNNVNIKKDITPHLTISTSQSYQIITYSISDNSAVSLAIYDVHGKKVKTLINGYERKGTFKVKWDYRNDFGQRIGNGCYIVRLAVNKSEISQKLIVTH